MSYSHGFKVDAFSTRGTQHIADNFSPIRPRGYGGDAPSSFMRATMSAIDLQSP